MGGAPPDPRPPVPFARLLPSLATVGALCLGLSAIRFASLGEMRAAAVLILAAAALDVVDGRLARMLRSESEMGAELDSLADFASFGVAPAFVLHFWAEGRDHPLLWPVLLAYAVCCCLRLARFNVGVRTPKEVPDTRFEGVPSPAGAFLALVPLYLGLAVPNWILHPLLIEAWVLLIGGLMISRLPTPSTKGLTVGPQATRWIVVGFVVALALLLTSPWSSLATLGGVYLGVVTWFAVRGRKGRGWTSGR